MGGWATLRRPYQQKHVVKLRRDLQRLNLLARHEAVVTTPQLDGEWKQVVGHSRNIVAVLKSIGGNTLMTPKQRRKFRPYWKCIALPPAGRRGVRRLQRQRLLQKGAES